jgi:mono/diheme cytochrome c family protein
MAIKGVFMSLLKSHPAAHRLSAAAAWIAAIVIAPAASAATPAELLSGYVGEAGAAANSDRGQLLFNSRHGREWSCAACHGAVPTAPGRHAATGKPIAALAPAFNPERFTDGAKADKWFRRNCNDVLGRECSAAEKADVLSWLIQLKP